MSDDADQHWTVIPDGFARVSREKYIEMNGRDPDNRADYLGTKSDDQTLFGGDGDGDDS